MILLSHTHTRAHTHTYTHTHAKHIYIYTYTFFPKRSIVAVRSDRSSGSNSLGKSVPRWSLYVVPLSDCHLSMACASGGWASKTRMPSRVLRMAVACAEPEVRQKPRSSSPIAEPLGRPLRVIHLRSSSGRWGMLITRGSVGFREFAPKRPCASLLRVTPGAPRIASMMGVASKKRLHHPLWVPLGARRFKSLQSES